MSLIMTFIQGVMHLDKSLQLIFQNYGILAYAILFLIIFCETGLVVVPFLPGDSLIFGAATLAVLGNANIVVLFLVLASAAILGNTVNYQIGRFIGPKIYETNNRFIKKEYLEKTHSFYEKHGGFTIIITRFMPVIRTFSPFVAGIGAMKYAEFMIYNVIGGITWVLLFSAAGYWFGNIDFVKKNFEIVMFGIVFVSLLPAILGVLKQKLSRKKCETEII